MAVQHWKHGWIPLTPQAMRQKNHGYKPGPDSKITKTAEQAIREKTAAAKTRRSGRRGTTPTGGGKGGTGGNRGTSQTPSPDNDIKAAAAAIRPGAPARAVNLLTRAMNNTKDPREKRAIKKRRDELARRIMGR